jgi:hypothetical protein
VKTTPFRSTIAAFVVLAALAAGAFAALPDAAACGTSPPVAATKGDLPHIVRSEAEYVTVESRENGVSVLMRFRLPAPPSGTPRADTVMAVHEDRGAIDHD